MALSVCLAIVVSVVLYFVYDSAIAQMLGITRNVAGPGQAVRQFRNEDAQSLGVTHVRWMTSNGHGYAQGSSETLPTSAAKRNELVAKLLQSGFARQSEDLYKVNGKSLDDVKAAIGFDPTSGSESTALGGMAAGDVCIILEMPYMRAVFEDSELSTSSVSQTFVRIRVMGEMRR